MTKRQKQLIALIDGYQARHDELPDLTTSADRAVGRVQRDHGLDMQDCLALLAFGLGYVKERYGTDEPTPGFDLDEHLGAEHKKLRGLGAKAGK